MKMPLDPPAPIVIKETKFFLKLFAQKYFLKKI